MHRKIFGVVVLLVLALTALPTAFAQPALDKIEPRLLDQFRTEGQADFVVLFTEQADLSPAYEMNWADSGEFVYNTLKATAARTQAGAQAYLNTLGLEHTTFIAGNELYVHAGNLDAATALAARAEISYIRAPKTAYVDPIIAEAPKAPEALAWGITNTKADQFWAAFGLQGDGIKVSNIDTGVQWDHPGLDQAFACPGDPGNANCWRDPSNICPGGTACDNNGHGSHTMGTMVSDDDPGLTWQAGMAPNATWIACKGCESNSCSEFALNTCADWTLAPGGSSANRPDVSNNSWGGSGCDLWYQAKVQAWRAAQIFPAFSAGNSGSGCSTLGSPGTYQESFASAAHDSSGNIASFSSRGPNVGSCPNDPYTKPNISAPGVSVCSTVPTNAWSCGYSGTSMASPHTAGAVALVWSCAPALRGQIDATFQLLQNTANSGTPAGNCGASPNGGNYTYGYGYLDVLAAGSQVCGGVALGALDGYVRDAGNNPIEGATVSAVPGYRGSTINATTDPTGYYTMSLVVGTYDVTASKMNYTSQTVQDIEIITGTVASQDFVLTFLGAWTPNTQPNCFDWTRIDAEFFPATGRVYVMGGRYDTSTVGDIYWFDPVANTCGDTGANMPTPISNYTINLVNNGTNDLLCTFGGRNSAGGQTLDVQCYDPVANTVSTVATLPTAYTGYTPGGQAVADNMVYVFGGFNPNAAPYELVRTDRFNPTTNTFTQVGNLSLGRSYLMAATVDGAIYAFGGTVFDGTNLNAQTRTEKMADPGGAGTWDNAAVAEMPQAGAEGQAFGFHADSIFGLVSTIVLAPAFAQWPGESNAVISYDTVADTYDQSFPDLNTARRNNAGAFVPICSENATDGLPGMWVIGGRSGADTPPYAGPEYYPMACVVEAPPVAAFSSDSPVCLGEPMQFTDESTGYPPVTEWYWDFGDGVGTSTEQDPSYTYTAAGDFVVTLWVTNTEGPDWIDDTVTVNALPEASFDYAPAAGLMPLTVYFSNTSPVGENPTWDFGDGGTDTGDFVNHTYAATGTYTVQLTVDNDCGSDTAEAEVYVYFETAPIASFEADPVSGCGAPLDVQFTDTSVAAPAADEWLWDFGDGETSTDQHPLHTYAETGDFVVTLWVTNTLGSDWVTGTIAVYDVPMAMFDYSPAVGNAPLTVYFTNTSMYGENPTWDFGDGNMGAGDNVTHTYEMTGTFTVVLTVTSPYGCDPATASADVTVYEEGACIPVSIVAVNQTPTGCVVDFSATLTGDAPFTYAWDFGAFGTFTTSTATVDFLATGTYTGTLNVWNCDQAGHDMEAFDVTVSCEAPPEFIVYLPLVFR